MLVSPRGRSALWHLCSAIIWSLFVSFLFRCPSKELTWAGRSPFHCAITAEIICSFSPSAVGSLAIYMQAHLLSLPECLVVTHTCTSTLASVLRCAALRLQGTRRKQPVSATQSCNPVPFAKISRPCAGVRIHAHGTHTWTTGSLAAAAAARAPATTSDMSPTGCKWPRHGTGEPSLLFLIRVIGDSLSA